MVRKCWRRLGSFGRLISYQSSKHGHPHALCGLRHDGADAVFDTSCLFVHYAVFVMVLLMVYAEVLDAFFFTLATCP